MSVRQNIPRHCPDGQLCDKIFKKFAKKSFLFKDIVRTGWHIVRTVARPLQVISL
jgi:hypothetical protein